MPRRPSPRRSKARLTKMAWTLKLSSLTMGRPTGQAALPVRLAQTCAYSLGRIEASHLRAIAEYPKPGGIGSSLSMPMTSCCPAHCGSGSTLRARRPVTSLFATGRTSSKLKMEQSSVRYGPSISTRSLQALRLPARPTSGRPAQLLCTGANS